MKTTAVIFLYSCLTAFISQASEHASTRLPVAQMGHHLLQIGDSTSLWLLPGFAGETILKDIYVYGESGWQVKSSMPFTDRTWYTATEMPHLKQVMLFGGKTMEREPFDETWLWDGATFERHESAGPSARSHHTAVYDVKRQVVVLFGGEANGAVLNDVWEWDGSNWKFIEVKGDQPEPRAAHMSAYDPFLKRVVIVGGVHADNQTRLQDTWAWDESEWMRLPNLPKPLAAAAAGTDQNGIYLVGGWSEGFEAVDDVYRLTDDGWHARDRSFGKRSFSVLSFIQNKGKLVLTGGMTKDFTPLDSIYVIRDDVALSDKEEIL